MGGDEVQRGGEGRRPKICVLGAGHGGHAMAAHTAHKGFTVNLFNRDEKRIWPVQQLGCIEMKGEMEGLGKLNVVTTDIEKALKDVDVLLVAVPAYGHRYIAEVCAPHLRDGQIIVLNPGRTGGAIEFRQVLKEKAVSVDVVVCEAETFLYACRCVGPGQVHIFRIKNSVPVAALPAFKTVEVMNVLRSIIPQYVPTDNVLRTSLNNMGAIFHPAITLLNASRIEDTLGDFQFYIDGISPSVSHILEELDRERVAVAEALGIRINSARDWLYLAYSAAGECLYEAIQANHGYKGIKAPITVHHRYIFEDVPMSLVPVASLGEMLGVETPTVRAIVHLASSLVGRDFWKEGRTVERLGLKGLSVREIRLMVVAEEEKG
ncbi:MAG: NAD/NADP octopine/nopaline dehydrogenase family protein [bacterium]